MKYNGQPLPIDFALQHLNITTVVPCELEKSSLALNNHCNVCKRDSYDLINVENWVGRKSGFGLFAKRDRLEGSEVFRVSQYKGPQLVTSAVKSYMEDQAYTNIVFIEYGEIID